MAFTFGLGSDTMLGSLQTDATQFKVQEMATNISQRVNATGNASSFVDFTFSHRNRFMQRDQENDNHATFLFEYLALLRTRMQKLLTDLTAALTDDLTKAMTDARDWSSGTVSTSDTDTNPADIKPAMQGNTANGVSDAGAARASYQFFQGFADEMLIAPSHGTYGGTPTTSPYFGQPTYSPIDAQVNSSWSASDPATWRHRVSPDHQVDADFGDVRVFGTATIVQGGLDDGLDIGILDTLNVDLPQADVTYWDEGGGFRVHKNRYTFTDPGGSQNGYSPQGSVDSAGGALDAGTERDTVLNIGYTNTANNSSLSENSITGFHARNLNDDGWDAEFPINPAEDDYPTGITQDVTGGTDTQVTVSGGGTVFYVGQPISITDEDGVTHIRTVTARTATVIDFAPPLPNAKTPLLGALVSAAPDAPNVDRYVREGRAKNRFEKVLMETIMELDQKNLLRDIFRFSQEYSFLNNLQVASTSSLATGSQMQASVFIEFVPTFGGSGVDDDNNGTLDADERYRPDLGGDIQIQFDRFSAFYHS